MSFKTAGSGAGTGATLGSWLGPLGVAIGALGGGLYGAYNNSKNGPGPGQFNQNTGMYSGSNIFSGMTPDQMSSWYTANPQWNSSLNLNGNPFLLPQLQQSSPGTSSQTAGSMDTSGYDYTGQNRFFAQGNTITGADIFGAGAFNPLMKWSFNGRTAFDRADNQTTDWGYARATPAQRKTYYDTESASPPTPQDPGYALASNFQNPFYQPPTGNNSFQYF